MFHWPPYQRRCAWFKLWPAVKTRGSVRSRRLWLTWTKKLSTRYPSMTHPAWRHPPIRMIPGSSTLPGPIRIILAFPLLLLLVQSEWVQPLSCFLFTALYSLLIAGGVITFTTFIYFIQKWMPCFYSLHSVNKVSCCQQHRSLSVLVILHDVCVYGRLLTHLCYLTLIRLQLGEASFLYCKGGCWSVLFEMTCVEKCKKSILPHLL